mgnify:CR=1 FL=1
MKISFIVPLYNCLPLTQAMLASLQATLPAGLAHEIIFVDDGSTDGTRGWLAPLPAPCRALLNEKNLGFAGACNRGAAVARGEFLFFLNNDLVLLPGWLEPMLAVVSAYADAGLVGNVQLNHATGAVDHTGLTFNAKGKPEHLTARGWSALRPVVAVTGACFAIRTATWRQLGGFDEGYVNGCEDVDLGLRARQAGLANYVVRRSVVRHHISASIGRKLRDEQNTARLVQRWRPVILTLIPPACARACVAAAWENPRDYVHSRLVREALLYAAGLLPQPTRLIRAAAAASLDLEAARWAHLLDGAPARPPREVAGILFPTYQDGAPVY